MTSGLRLRRLRPRVVDLPRSEERGRAGAGRDRGQQRAPLGVRRCRRRLRRRDARASVADIVGLLGASIAAPRSGSGGAIGSYVPPDRPDGIIIPRPRPMSRRGASSLLAAGLRRCAPPARSRRTSPAPARRTAAPTSERNGSARLSPTSKRHLRRGAPAADTGVSVKRDHRHAPLVAGRRRPRPPRRV